MIDGIPAACTEPTVQAGVEEGVEAGGVCFDSTPDAVVRAADLTGLGFMIPFAGLGNVGGRMGVVDIFR